MLKRHRTSRADLELQIFQLEHENIGLRNENEVLLSNIKVYANTPAVVWDIADGFARQLRDIEQVPDEHHRELYAAATRDNIIMVVSKLLDRYPTFHYSVYYKRAGYRGTHPVHG